MLIRNLELVLENCEHIIIDGKYIGLFHAGDIRREISRLGCNHIGIMDVCHEFYVEVHKDANKRYAPFGDVKCETVVFDRLMKYKDITSVVIHLYDQYDENKDDESKDIVEHYYIHWEGDSDYENDVQHSKVSKTGWLYIAIGKDVNIGEVFPDEEVDDEEYADFHASMMDIGDKYWTEHEEMLKNNSDTESNDGMPTANSEIEND